MTTENSSAAGASPTGNAEAGVATLPAKLSSPGHDRNSPTLERRLFVVLGAVALVAAFITGLKTLADPDFFWQLATGRWVAQHHQVFSTDVFSYTAAGQPWIYPVGSGLLFYGLYLLGGYWLLSWLGAAAACGTVALLLRRGSAVTAAMAIVAVPLITSRTAPRAEMFSVVLFAAYLSIAWENYRSGSGRLWLLPLLMIAWVNLHLGFVSGLGLLAAFVAIDLLQMLDRARRAAARQRLRRSVPWFAATAMATLLNPWGWNVYAALIRQNRAMAEHSEWISEWGRLPLNATAISHIFRLHNPSPFYGLLMIAAMAVVAALWQRDWGAALLLLAAAYQGVQHLRMQALAAGMIVVVAGSVLLPVCEKIGRSVRVAKARAILAGSAAALVIFVAATWSADALKINDTAASSFGTGLSWWFPERAAAFIDRANIPGQLFNSYNDGGYIVWRLGPGRRDYIDGRAIPFGPGALLHFVQVVSASPDSAAWQAEADRYNINTVLLPLSRFQGELAYAKGFCNSQKWKPVYLDAVSGVFVRRTPQTEDLIRRSAVDCAQAPLPQHTPAGGRPARFNEWANAAVLLAELGRNDEALAAAEKVQEIVPDSGFVPWLRGNVAYTKGNLAEAEREYRQAIAGTADLPLFWFSLAVVYKHEGRVSDTIHAQRQAIDLSTTPKPHELIKLARLYLDSKQPKAALATFDEAAGTASPDILATTGEFNLQFEVDQGRAEAWRALGDAKQAAAFEQRAVQDLVPRQ